MDPTSPRREASLFDLPGTFGFPAFSFSGQPPVPLPLHRAGPRGQYGHMSEDKQTPDTTEDHKPTGMGKTVRARMFLITMLLLFAGTVGLLVFAYLRSGPPGS